MPEANERPSKVRELFRALPLETETARFVLVSVLDLVMTYLLISRRGFVESNPIAVFFLNHWGLRGLIWFKMGMVALIAIIAQVIACRRVVTARWVLNIATVLTAGVVVYSLTLLLRHGGI